MEISSRHRRGSNLRRAFDWGGTRREARLLEVKIARRVLTCRSRSSSVTMTTVQQTVDMPPPLTTAHCHRVSAASNPTYTGPFGR